MKKIILLLTIIIVLAGCKGAYKTTSGGKEDIGYLSIVGDPQKYKAGVLVSIDGSKPEIVEVVEDGKLSKTDSRLKTPTGKHAVQMIYLNKVVYSQTLIFFAQETKKITLP